MHGSSNHNEDVAKNLRSIEIVKIIKRPVKVIIVVALFICGVYVGVPYIISGNQTHPDSAPPTPTRLVLPIGDQNSSFRNGVGPDFDPNATIAPDVIKDMRKNMAPTPVATTSSHK